MQSNHFYVRNVDELADLNTYRPNIPNRVILFEKKKTKNALLNY